MALEFAASSRAEVSPSVATGRPLTIAGWFHADPGTTGYVVALCDASGENLIGLVIVGGGATCGATERSAGTFNPSSMAAFTTGVWQHAAAVFSGTNTRRGFVNGLAAAAVSQGDAATNIDRCWLRTRAGFTSTDDGIRLAEIGVWQAALTDTEIAALATGISPLALRHRLSDLVLYQPLYRALGHTMVGPQLTLVGSAAAYHHPRIVPGLAAIPTSRLPTTPDASPLTFAGSLFLPGAETAETFLPGPERGAVVPC